MNHAMDEATVTLNINGEGTGGSFMLPMGAEVQLADVVMYDNTAGGFDLTLSSSGQRFPWNHAKPVIDFLRYTWNDVPIPECNKLPA